MRPLIIKPTLQLILNEWLFDEDRQTNGFLLSQIEVYI